FDLGSGDGDALSVGGIPECLPGVGHVPQLAVAGVQQHRSVQLLPQLGGDGDVVVVTVGAYHGNDVPAADGLGDRLVVVSGVDDHDLVVVTDQPDVVVYLPAAAVKLEDATGHDPV